MNYRGIHRWVVDYFGEIYATDPYTSRKLHTEYVKMLRFLNKGDGNEEEGMAGLAIVISTYAGNHGIDLDAAVERRMKTMEKHHQGRIDGGEVVHK